MDERPLLIAVDGGNSKTHLALVGGDGEVLALERGPLSSPHLLGLDGSLAVLDGLLDAALATAGRGREEGVVIAAVAQVLMAGADLPEEEQRLHEAIAERGWADELTVANDTFAVLRAGTDRSWGVAVVCGAGINCVGVGPDGRQARFPSLGPVSGDWGGGWDLGMAALGAAARSADGRGPRTVLEQLVPGHFGYATAEELGAAMHRGELDGDRVVELAPLVLAAAPGDAVARELVERQAAEIVALARVALQRLDLLDADAEVVLGGGLLRAGHADLIAAVHRDLALVAPRVQIQVAADPPIVGAVLLGLDALGADAAARGRARVELRAAGA